MKKYEELTPLEMKVNIIIRESYNEIIGGYENELMDRMIDKLPAKETVFDEVLEETLYNLKKTDRSIINRIGMKNIILKISQEFFLDRCNLWKQNKKQIIEMLEEYGQGVSYTADFETKTVRFDDYNKALTFNEITDLLYLRKYDY